ncbi:MAG: hypothetical protein AAF378_17655 [Cyanobacteria bacterium P01_A01_bin.84]
MAVKVEENDEYRLGEDRLEQQGGSHQPEREVLSNSYSTVSG